MGALSQKICCQFLVRSCNEYQPHSRLKGGNTRSRSRRREHESLKHCLIGSFGGSECRVFIKLQAAWDHADRLRIDSKSQCAITTALERGGACKLYFEKTLIPSLIEIGDSLADTQLGFAIQRQSTDLHVCRASWIVKQRDRRNTCVRGLSR